MFGLRGLEPGVRNAAECAFKIAGEYGIVPVITSTKRSWAEQVQLRQRWERGESEFPANRPGDSAHQFGMAFDSWVPDEQMDDWARLRRLMGLHVPENDLIHAEWPGWRNCVEPLFP